MVYAYCRVAAGIFCISAVIFVVDEFLAG